MGFKGYIINSVQQKILQRYNDTNDLTHYTYCGICGDYVFKLKQEFPEHISKEIEPLLDVAGYHIGCAVKAYITSNPDFVIGDVLQFVENFLKIQLDDIGNWCGHDIK